MQTSRPGDSNLAVYDSTQVAEHYARLDYLTECEQAIFKAHLRPGMNILDLGVGGGRTTGYLASIAKRYVGVDYALKMVEACRAKFPGLEFHTADAADLSVFRDGSFDAVVFAFNGIDYVVPDANRERCLQECRRLLRCNGVLVFSTHNPRAVFVRALWDQQRVRTFATSLAGEKGYLLGPVTAGATCAKAVISACRAAAESAGRIARRVPRAMFWRGEGWLRDPSHGGLTQHYATPAKVIAETEQYGFQMLQVLGDDYPRVSRRYITDWYYYVFAKRSGGEQIHSCE
jgi:ubiquinone/menaquinone biosynthesis C-methylase UbiE